jgi:non-ribosomal peptide synthetase component F/thioesterase domain-containing protein/aryl carrier-like protein
MQESKLGPSLAPARDAVGRRIYPCSAAQAHFVYQERIDPGCAARNVFARWRLEGEVLQADLQDAWSALVARHESLRTRFSEADGAPLQIVEPRVDLHVRDIDLTLLQEPVAALEAERIAALEARTPFALDLAPLLRVTHVRLRPGVSVLMVTAHHTVCDGWSMGILAREMGELCAARYENRAPVLADLTVNYGEYALRQRDWLAGDSLETERAALARALAGYKQFEILPDRPRPAVQTANGDIVSTLLERELTDRLAALARDNGCTLFTVAYAALLAVLHRHSGETDIALGTQVAGRDAVELEPLIGTFVNTIVLRTDLRGDPTFRELVERARDAQCDAFELRHVPTGIVVEVVNPPRDPSRNPLLSLNFVFQRSFVPNARYGSFALVDLPSRSAGALYDLCFFMVERPEGWRLSCEYNPDLFESATATKLVARMTALLEAAGRNPSLALSDLPILSAADRDELRALDGTLADYPHEPLHELFARQAALAPNAIAATCGDARASYRELDEAANRLARELLRRAPQPLTAVGILLERSLDALVAVLAVLKVGAAYVAIEPLADDAALTAEVRARAGAWITRRQFTPRLAGLPAPLVLLDADAASIATHAGDGIGITDAADAAYLTRGAAGSLVPVGRRAVVNAAWALRKRLVVRPRDCVLATAPPGSGESALEIFTALLSGAQLVVAREDELGDGDALDRLIGRSGATVMHADCATWQRLANSEWPGSPALKALCTQRLPEALAARLIAGVNELWSIYGEPETGACSFARRVEAPDDGRLVGRPIENVAVSIVDAWGKPVPPGAPGELLLGGDGVRLHRTGRRARSRPAGDVELLAREDAPAARPAPAPPPTVAPVVPATATETQLAGIVAELLGHGGFARHDDVFAFGFHSLLALRLVARIKQRYGVDLALRTIVETPTVAQMAARVDALRAALPEADSVTPIVTLNASGTRTPLIFLHSDLFADGLYCRRLAASLGPDQPIHSVAPHGTAGLPLFTSVGAMARDYLPRIRAVQPAGPYRIGGFCASAFVAYELARLLRAQGEAVERVVLINASPLPTRSIPPFDAVMRALGLNRRLDAGLRTALCYNLARLHAAVARGPMATVRLAFERISALSKRGAKAGAGSPELKKERGERRTENSFVHIVAAFTYHPKPYDGLVSLIWSDDQRAPAAVPRASWSALAPEVRCIGMRGGHVEALGERIDDLARAVEAALA